MNVAVPTPPQRRQRAMSRPPRAPARDFAATLKEQIPLLVACAALVVLCCFAIAAANGQPALS